MINCITKRHGLEIKSMERKAIFIGNFFYLFNNFIKIMCCAIYHYKMNLSNYLWNYTYSPKQLMKQDIQCGLRKFCESTSGFCYYSKIRRILGFPFNCQRLYNIRVNTTLSSAIISIDSTTFSI